MYICIGMAPSSQLACVASSITQGRLSRALLDQAYGGDDVVPAMHCTDSCSIDMVQSTCSGTGIGGGIGEKLSFKF